MKIIYPLDSNSKPSLSSIKTVVYYKWSSFIPTNAEMLVDRDSQKEKLMNLHGSSDFYYSSGNSSDFLTFSEYGFKVNPEKEDLRGFVKSNYFDSDLLTKAKDDTTNKYDQDILINFEDYLLPQISNEEVGENFKKKFFGTVTNESSSIIYLDIPGDENGSPVWMIELYEDYLETNHSFTGKKKDPFISYELLKLISPERIKSKPYSIIKFGPEPEHLNNDDSFYYKENKEDYYLIKDSFKIPEEEWLSLYREITSKEILKIVISPKGLIDQVINLSKISWEVSKNPNRNQETYSLRNDIFWATRDYYEVDHSSEILKDNRSGSIIATKKLEDYTKLPIISTKLKGLKNRFSPRKAYKEAETVFINDYLYSSLISGNLGENPQCSNYWKQIGKYEEDGDEYEKYLNDPIESLTLLRNNLASDYYQAYIHVNNKDFGIVKPSGLQKFRTGENFSQTLEISPNAGYTIDSLIVNIDDIRKERGYYTYEVEKQSYVYNFPKDIKSSIDIKIIFNNINSGLRPYSLKLSDNEKYLSSFSINDIEINNTTINNIKIEFYTVGYDNEGNIQLEKINDFSSETNFFQFPKDKTSLSPESPIVMFIDDTESSYSFSSLTIQNKGILKKVNNDSKEDIYIYKNNHILFKTECQVESYDLIFEVVPKKLNCQVIPDLGIDVSSLGDYVDYASGFSVSFTGVNDYKELSKIIINDNEWEWNDNTDNDKTLSTNGEIYTLSINPVLQDLKIKIISKDKI